MRQRKKSKIRQNERLQKQRDWGEDQNVIGEGDRHFKALRFISTVFLDITGFRFEDKISNSLVKLNTLKLSRERAFGERAMFTIHRKLRYNTRIIYFT